MHVAADLLFFFHFCPLVETEYLMSLEATPTAGAKLLTPTDHTLVMIDFQSQMAFATHSIDAVNLRNNAALVAQAAAGFEVPTILTTVAEKSFSGPMFSEVTDAFPGQRLLDRTSMNTWEDAAVIEEVNRIGKDRIVFAGLWTSLCASSGRRCRRSTRASRCTLSPTPAATCRPRRMNRAMERMVQAGAQPMTSLQYLLELQRDWARGRHLRADHRHREEGRAAPTAWAMTYAKTMFGAHEG
jgi:nicotinamidase-related amidase